VHGEPWFDEEKFLAGAREMLDGVKAFWDGLESDRQARRVA
jgi:predicted lipid-binding transport protein (Tim44 family)